MKRRWPILLFLLGLQSALIGCSDNLIGNQLTPDIELTVSQRVVFLPLGIPNASASVQISVHMYGALGDSATVSVSGLGAGVSVVPASTFTMSNGATQTLVFQATADAQPGTQVVSLQATSGPVVRIETVSLAVQRPEYTYVASAASANATPVQITGYRLDPDTGSISTLAGAPASLTEAVIALSSVTESGGSFLFALTSDGTNQHLSSFRIDGGTGALTPVQTIAFGSTEGKWLSIAPSGKFLYTQRFNSTNRAFCVVAYLVDPNTGYLTESSCTAGEPRTIVIAPPGNFAYLNGKDGSLNGYVVNPSDGSLTAMQGAIPDATITALASDPRGLALDTLRPNYYGCAVLESWTIDSNSGSLTYAGNVPPEDLHLGSLSCYPGNTVFTPSGDFAYIYARGHYMHDPNATFVLSVDHTTGKLTEIGPAGTVSDFQVVFAAEPLEGRFVIASGGGAGPVVQPVDTSTGKLLQPVSTIVLTQPVVVGIVVVAPTK